MIAVDTNIIVRLLTKDDLKQYQRSFKLFQEYDVFICDTAILETEWVLRFSYKFSPSEINQAFKKLFGLPNVYLADISQIAQVLNWYQAGLDFPDAFHLAQSQHCSEFYTFERKFLIKAKNSTECEVVEP